MSPPFEDKLSTPALIWAIASSNVVAPLSKLATPSFTCDTPLFKLELPAYALFTPLSKSVYLLFNNPIPLFKSFNPLFKSDVPSYILSAPSEISCKLSGTSANVSDNVDTTSFPTLLCNSISVAVTTLLIICDAK